MQRETAETTNFDTLSTGQGIRHMFQQRFHCGINVFMGQLSLL